MLNDNNMSISPSVGALSAYLSRARSSTWLNAAPAHDPARDQAHPAHRRRRRGRPAALVPLAAGHHPAPRAGHHLRGARLLLLRPDRRPRHRRAAHRLPRHALDAPPGADPRGHAARAAATRTTSRKRPATTPPAAASRRPPPPSAEYPAPGRDRRFTAAFAEQATRHARARSARRRAHRRDARRHRSDQGAAALPRPRARRRHGRAARRRRSPPAWRWPATADLRHLLDLPAARLRPALPGSGAAERAGDVLPRSRRRWSAPTARRTTASSTSPTCAACRTSS